jgi:probable F420-dependent oxidoreductase
VIFDASLPPASLEVVPELARAAEAAGFDAVWSSETQHDPFLPLALVAEHTQRLQFGSAVAIGLARSPTTLAHTAWDLAGVSGGRFILGLGTQVKAHIERRFGMVWPDSPAAKLREMVFAIRAIWHSWLSGERLNFRGTYYRLTLMTPFFSPEPIEHPHIPIFIAGVNPGLCRLAGEVADGLHAHPYHSVRYLREVVLPAVEAGRQSGQRPETPFQLSVTAFVVTHDEQAAYVCSQLAFYASTPSYRPVMALHGWGAVADELQQMARRQAWDAMPSLITPEMLETFAVVACPEDLAGALKARYQGIADRLGLYLPYRPGERDPFWRSLRQAM